MSTFKTENVVVEKKRSSNIEVLRFILCIFVVIIHVHGIFDYSLSLTYSAVTIFAIISGFFLFEKNDSYLGFKFIPTIIFLLVLNMLITLIAHSITGSLNSVDWVKTVLFGQTQFWYLWAMLFTLFISPLLFLGVKHLGKCVSLMIILVFYLVVQISSLDYVYTVDSYRFSNPFVLFFSLMFGAWIKKYWENSFLLNKKLVLRMCFPILVTLVSIQVLAQILLLNVAEGNSLYLFLSAMSSLSTSNQNPLTIVTGFCIFSLFYIWEIKYNKFLNYLGGLSIIVYASHYAILYWYKDQIVSNWEMGSELKDLVILSLTLITSLIIAIVISPIFKIYQMHIKKLYKQVSTVIKNRSNQK